MDVNVIALAALQDGFFYLVNHPGFLLRAALHGAQLRLGIPLDALRWLAQRLLVGPKAPREVSLQPAPPGVGVAMTVSIMDMPLRVSFELHIEGLRPQPPQLLLTLRVRQLAIQAPPDSPAAQMIAAMDLSKPGNLMTFVPYRPPLLVEACDDRFVLDLMKLPTLSQSEPLRRAVLALAEVLLIREVRFDRELLLIALRPNPRGLPAALAHIRA